MIRSACQELEVLWAKSGSWLGSVAHQEKRCSCFGGTASDDPILTRRQAAEAAADIFSGGRTPECRRCLRGAVLLCRHPQTFSS